MRADGGQPDSEGDGALHVGPPAVGGAEDGEDQHEGAEDLHAEALGLRQVLVHLRHAHTVAVLLGCDALWSFETGCCTDSNPP